VAAPALAGRHVVLGVCGGIAAYKAVEVCRRLVDAGAVVSPVLTPAATRFVGEVTFSALAGEPVRRSLWEAAEPIPHTRLGQSADVVVVAPATARLLGAYRAGLSSDLLVATLLATRAPVLLCPAMHTEMWEHPAVADNVATLRARGVHFIGPVSGPLAGGDRGAGRLADPEQIVAGVLELLDPSPGVLAGRRAVVTAGGTREPIDAVRFVGNRSSGKQGYAVAAELARRGAAVTLVSTVDLARPEGVEVVAVETAAQMDQAVSSRAAEADVVVMAAAVADFRPRTAAAGKLKKAAGPPELVLEPTADILAGLSPRRRPGQVVVGFAAEAVTGSDPAPLLALARAKLDAKGCDLLVANDVAAAGAGFGHDTNAVLVVSPGGVVADTGLVSKAEVAVVVVDAIVATLPAAAPPGPGGSPCATRSVPGRPEQPKEGS